MDAFPARQAPPHTTISRPVHTPLAPCRPRNGPTASLRHPLGRAGPAPGSVGNPTIGPLPFGAAPDPPDPPVPPPAPEALVVSPFPDAAPPSAPLAPPPEESPVA